jgi:6-phosphogluconolactonase (cycloisomerase 2 family)
MTFSHNRFSGGDECHGRTFPGQLDVNYCNYACSGFEGGAVREQIRIQILGGCLMTRFRSLVLFFLPRKLFWRFSSETRLRKLRGLIRSPGLWALAFGTSIPTAALASRSAKLDRPESISVSASGEKIVVSNSGGRNVAIYSFADSRPENLDLRLTDVIADDQLFHYAHGAIFGVSDEIVLAVGEYSHSLTAIDVSLQQQNSDQSRILWTVSGRDNGLDNPADLALHPSGEWIAVTNRMGSGICILRLGEARGSSPPELVHSIDVSKLNSYGLAAPHGAAISPDGAYMFVTHKRYSKGRSDTGNSSVSVFSTEVQCPTDESWTPVAIKDYKSADLHHIACHPLLDIIALTSSTGDIEVLSWDREANALETIASIDVFRLGEGVKGISFMKNGEHLVITSELDEILFFELEEHVATFGNSPAAIQNPPLMATSKSPS